MPLIVLSGQPCSGKSTVAAKLQELLQPSHPVCIVDELKLHLERNSAYQTTVQEKATRGTLKSAVERAISKKTVIILDSLNNIKGYRYELWCVARAAGTRYVMVHVATPTQTCSEWNTARPDGQRYSDAVFQDLAGRFETPDARNRWDAPLFTVRPGSPDEASVLAAAAAAAIGSPLQQPQQQQQQQQQPCQGAGAAGSDPAADVDSLQEEQLLHQGALPGELQPTIATTNPALLGTNVLHELDRAVQDVVSRILEVQQLAPAGGASGCMIDLGHAGRLMLERHLPLAELRRHKRSFLKLATKVTFSRLQDPAAAQRMFVDYVKQQLAAAGADPRGSADGYTFPPLDGALCQQELISTGINRVHSMAAAASAEEQRVAALVEQLLWLAHRLGV
ncbi:chromatin associated protein KTI12 [Scenedesmus sp. NREL 46B-D3]|nr:chromatin associated protein KTI12 [Scenedesmus sp. NREL 46B-D3]